LSCPSRSLVSCLSIFNRCFSLLGNRLGSFFLRGLFLRCSFLFRGNRWYFLLRRRCRRLGCSLRCCITTLSYWGHWNISCRRCILTFSSRSHISTLAITLLGQSWPLRGCWFSLFGFNNCLLRKITLNLGRSWSELLRSMFFTLCIQNILKL